MRRPPLTAGVVAAVVVTLACGVLPPCATTAHAQNTTSEYWPELGIYWSMTQRYRLYALAQMQVKHDIGESQVAYGLHIDDMAMSHGYARFGYRYLYKLNDPSHPENRLVLEAGMHGVGATRFVNRFRVDLRNQSGALSARLRDRPRVEHELHAGTIMLLPYAMSELFYDSSVGGLSRVRSQTGSEVHFTKTFGLDLAYVRQDDWHYGTSHVNALLTKLLLTF